MEQSRLSEGRGDLSRGFFAGVGGGGRGIEFVKWEKNSGSETYCESPFDPSCPTRTVWIIDSENFTRFRLELTYEEGIPQHLHFTTRVKAPTVLMLQISLKKNWFSPKMRPFCRIEGWRFLIHSFRQFSTLLQLFSPSRNAVSRLGLQIYVPIRF